MERVTEQQILDAISDASKTRNDSNPHGAVTCREISKNTTMTRGWVNRKLVDLVESGIIKVTKVCKMRIDGAPNWAPAYFLSENSDKENPSL